MISRLKIFLAALSLSLAVPFVGFATEKNPQDNEGNQQQPQENKEDSLGIYDDENKFLDPFTLEDQMMISQEAINAEPTVPSTNTKQSPKVTVEEDAESNSAMSFNFIYYIIDKFKLADPLD